MNYVKRVFILGAGFSKSLAPVTECIKLHGSFNWFRARGALQPDLNNVYIVPENRRGSAVVKKPGIQWILIGSMIISGCVYPVPVSTECQRTIHRCLQNCDPSGKGVRHGTSDTSVPSDYRSPCEQSCHVMCH